MTEILTLGQLARQVMTHELGKIQDSEALAVAAVNVYATLVLRMSSSMGLAASVMLFRRSVQYKAGASIPFALALADEQHNLLNAIGRCLRTQTPDMARESSGLPLILWTPSVHNSRREVPHGPTASEFHPGV